MYPTPIRAIACLAAACTLTAFGTARAQTHEPEPQRNKLIRALEALIATGQPEHTTHDEGERMQLAVNDAIARGDTGVERIAIRAASPLTARMIAPVHPTDHLPSVVLSARTVLKVPRPLTYSARMYASVDGTGFVQVPDQVSGKGGGFRIDALGITAVQPGFHQVRLRAHLTFGDPAEPAWTEVRDLPLVFYALYDPNARSRNDARGFIDAPAAVIVREFDPLLGDEPFSVWLTGLLSPRRAGTRVATAYFSQYCSDRTAEPGSRPDPTAVCSVVNSQSGDQIGRIWFRTGDIHVNDGGVEWMPVAPPRFEGLDIRKSALESHRLSALPLLLDTDPAFRPTGDVVITPEDIVITPGTPKPGAPAVITVTVRNQGQGDLHKLMVDVAFGSVFATRGTTRRFVVDVPTQSSVEVVLDAVFPQGFGIVMANASQVSEYAPYDTWTPDPTPENGCAVRFVNPRAAPPGYFEPLRDAARPCPGR